jgi:AcrR family transcriptional regulator
VSRTGIGRGPRRPWTDREQRLLDAIEEIFFAEGFADLSVADLATRLRVSRSTLYKLAPSKQDLIELVIDRMFRRMGGRACAALETASDPAERVAVYLGTGTATVRGGIEFSRGMEANAGTRAIYDRHQAIGMKVLAGLIDDGVRSGRFRHVQALLVMQIADAAHARLRDPGVLTALGVTHAHAIDELIGILLQGIASDGAGEAAATRIPGPGSAIGAG